MTRRNASPRPVRRLLGRGDTRQALIEGALALLDGDKSFDGLSLRELTREVGIVPTAFYRHFSAMEPLGLALVDESFRALRQILEDVRKDAGHTDKPVAGIVRSLLKHVQTHRRHFRFIASERFGGSAVVREAIRREMRLVHGELAIELARFPYLREWTASDLHMIASLILNAMVAIAQEVLERTSTDRYAEKELTQLAEKQLRLILLGVPQWRSAAP